MGAEQAHFPRQHPWIGRATPPHPAEKRTLLLDRSRRDNHSFGRLAKPEREGRTMDATIFTIASRRSVESQALSF
jgi:hypothetical protein